ncbi:MAG: protein kinase domain-containing protein [Thermodesulfobacteriota bacterium]
MKYGRYEVVGELGKGAMGVVFNAHDPKIDRLVALKALRPDYVNDEYFVQRFFKEAVAIGRLSHPNIVIVYDVGQDQGTIYIAMEFLMGRPLSDIAKEGKIPLQQVTEIGIQVAEALDYAHRKGVVHRDIKPANIILTEDNQAKITDFGIAHVEDPTATLQTQAGEILGTPVYMSPEQVLGHSPDGRSDLYSLGVILYELATGQRPFKGRNMATIFRAVSQDKPDPPQIVDPDIPKGFSDLILKSLEKDPAKRFQTGKEMAEALRACHDDDQCAPVPAPSAGRKKKIAVRSLISIFCLLLIVVGGKFLIDFVTAPDTPPPQAVLDIKSDPQDAQVFINGETKGRTPLELELPLGKYEVRMQMPQYFDWQAQIELEKAEKVPLFVKLNKIAF